VIKVAEKIAELRGISVEEVGRQTSDNFYRFFDLLPGGKNVRAS
jgi:TatD DNase family protein